ncbi:hypothetical protein GGD81_002229 [Rhodobium orientis]|uniref:Uncharacterized protein n=1 Tax=Rhodobium orientis TaxID=34017 RepID=A0A327JFT6_9HYPH|nr:hypothetical protein [Rhodobium orientis]MBB4303186.1 hypothetical protein [Rhodobium orientis]MBK5951713.1 hypothetical protein [Rhodobium orientis]RAI24995.1 hypothetical protein CH339_20160 [Rhodobium orientis]
MQGEREDGFGREPSFKRPAERLVLEGYRYWSSGCATRSTEPWAEAQLLYCRVLGDRDGRQGIIALADFVKTLGECATCPLRRFHSGSRAICRDETLVIGLIAGLQNGDDQTTAFCLHRLCCPQLCDTVAAAAGNFALTLKCFDKVMLPVAVHVLVRLLAATRDGDDDPSGGAVLH